MMSDVEVRLLNLLQVIVPEVEEELDVKCPTLYFVESDRGAYAWFNPKRNSITFNINKIEERINRVSSLLGYVSEDVVDAVIAFTIYHEFKHVHQSSVLGKVHQIGRKLPVYELSKEIEADTYALSKVKEVNKEVARSILKDKRRHLNRESDSKRTVALLINKAKKVANW